MEEKLHTENEREKRERKREICTREKIGRRLGKREKRGREIKREIEINMFKRKRT